MQQREVAWLMGVYLCVCARACVFSCVCLKQVHWDISTKKWLYSSHGHQNITRTLLRESAQHDTVIITWKSYGLPDCAREKGAWKNLTLFWRILISVKIQFQGCSWLNKISWGNIGVLKDTFCFDVEKLINQAGSRSRKHSAALPFARWAIFLNLCLPSLFHALMCFKTKSFENLNNPFVPLDFVRTGTLNRFVISRIGDGEVITIDRRVDSLCFASFFSALHLGGA